MAHIVLTVVGDDRSGLVRALADTIAAHEGNWEQSELAELAGAFAGIVLVDVPDDRLAALTTALGALDGLLRIATHDAPAGRSAAPASSVSFTVLGNDRPGIVRDVTAVVAAHSLGIITFRSRTLEAPMSGGSLFEATVTVRLAAEADAGALASALEDLAGEIQVDVALD